MQVVTNIDFSSYSHQQIIDFIEDGLVTVQEVDDSGVAFKFFGNTLHDYLRVARRDRLEDTIAI